VTDARAQRIMERLGTSEQGRLFPNVRPRDAATLIILDRKSRRPRVLMGRRHPGHRFMPGMFVFPGGAVEAGDRSMPVSGALHPRSEQALMARVPRASAHRSRALALAAIRETFEETGLMLGTKEHGPPEAPAGAWEAFREHGVFPDLEVLQVVARAITPPRRSKRFDTRFFAADRTAIADEVEGVVGADSELVEIVWVTIDGAKSLELPAITLAILEELEERIENGLSHELPVPFYYHRGGRIVRELI
jgi:8-oxo-dGTP pyrophosphatase MutT (NUDIX family)